MPRTDDAERVRRIATVLFFIFLLTLTPYALAVGWPCSWAGLLGLQSQCETPSPPARWVRIDTVRARLRTADHHCERDCAGEPTAMAYTIGLTAPVSASGKRRRLVEPILGCEAGPCAFSRVAGPPTLSEDGTRAQAHLTVWSRPTDWVLSATVEELRE